MYFRGALLSFLPLFWRYLVLNFVNCCGADLFLEVGLDQVFVKFFFLTYLVQRVPTFVTTLEEPHKLTFLYQVNKRIVLSAGERCSVRVIEDDLVLSEGVASAYQGKFQSSLLFRFLLWIRLTKCNFSNVANIGFDSALVQLIKFFVGSFPRVHSL